MRMRIPSVVALVFVAMLAGTQVLPRAAGSSAARDPKGVTVHEWGTFTSVAGQDGRAVAWLPQQGPPDLPCFVHEVNYGIKGLLPGLIRMETPVLYFYAQEPATVDVKVRFRQGVVTEWYPQAVVSPARVESTTLQNPSLEGSIAWNRVEVRPRSGEAYRTEAESSHYYVARRTDAAPLQVGSQQEKFLFYRGVGGFEPPLAAVVGADGRVAVRAARGQRIGDVMLFENVGGRARFQWRRAEGNATTLDLQQRADSIGGAMQQLRRTLVSHGLYQREAEAMVETWRDSWFEEGTRLFYVLPSAAVDEILPLQITPAPREIVRVFVGRIEIFTPSALGSFKQAVLSRDGAAIAKYGRFFRPMAARTRSEVAAPAEVALLDRALPMAYSAFRFRERPLCQ